MGDSSFGLAHILERRTQDFIKEGLSEAEAQAKAREFVETIPQIVENGRVVTQNNVTTIWHKQGRDYYKIGISKGFHGQGDNKWILTGYKTDREKDKTFGDALFTDKQPLSNSKNNSSTNLFKQQDIDFKNFEDFSKYAKLSGIEFESEREAKEAYKHIQSRLKDLEY